MDDETKAAPVRLVPVIGEIGAGDVVTFYPGAERFLARHRRIRVVANDNEEGPPAET